MDGYDWLSSCTVQVRPAALCFSCPRPAHPRVIAHTRTCNQSRRVVRGCKLFIHCDICSQCTASCPRLPSLSISPYNSPHSSFDHVAIHPLYRTFTILDSTDTSTACICPIYPSISSSPIFCLTATRHVRAITPPNEGHRQVCHLWFLARSPFKSRSAARAHPSSSIHYLSSQG